jgi:hypothetical protein
MKTRYRIFKTESDSEEEEKYSSFVQEEEFEGDEECEGFQGVQKGSEIERVWEPREWTPTILPWDPSENFFAYI